MPLKILCLSLCFSGALSGDFSDLALPEATPRKNRIIEILASKLSQTTCEGLSFIEIFKKLPISKESPVDSSSVRCNEKELTLELAVYYQSIKLSIQKERRELKELIELSYQDYKKYSGGMVLYSIRNTLERFPLSSEECMELIFLIENLDFSSSYSFAKGTVNENLPSISPNLFVRRSVIIKDAQSSILFQAPSPKLAPKSMRFKFFWTNIIEFNLFKRQVLTKEKMELLRYFSAEYSMTPPNGKVILEPERHTDFSKNALFVVQKVDRKFSMYIDVEENVAFAKFEGEGDNWDKRKVETFVERFAELYNVEYFNLSCEETLKGQFECSKPSGFI